ncbi:HAD-IA family hydrolase [Membranihabitans maritimus]|uniref:HAD-IA family hydrolase n=1 Tax=Membranihabitans maritimus TaxID=2904244 RepID=UPI001F032B25|nr:HAD-IA family hydrolase [Membranihabitans maritimus]
MQKNVSVLIFDFGNVIIDIDMSKTFSKLSTLLDFDLNSLLTDKENLFIRYEMGLISTEAFLNDLIRRSNKPTQANEIVSIWNAILLGIPKERIDLLLELRKQYSIYILSNTNDLHIQWVHRYLKREFKLENFERSILHNAFYSHHLKTRKPRNEIYEKVHSKIDKPKDEVLFLDDLEENVKAAQTFGWNAFHHPAQGDLKESLSKNGVHL